MPVPGLMHISSRPDPWTMIATNHPWQAPLCGSFLPAAYLSIFVRSYYKGSGGLYLLSPTLSQKLVTDKPHKDNAKGSFYYIVLISSVGELSLGGRTKGLSI